VNTPPRAFQARSSHFQNCDLDLNHLPLLENYMTVSRVTISLVYNLPLSLRTITTHHTPPTSYASHILRLPHRTPSATRPQLCVSNITHLSVQATTGSHIPSFISHPHYGSFPNISSFLELGLKRNVPQKHPPHVVPTTQSCHVSVFIEI
jgi:hypothetical protein